MIAGTNDPGSEGHRMGPAACTAHAPFAARSYQHVLEDEPLSREAQASGGRYHCG